MSKKVVPFNRSLLEDFLNTPNQSDFVVKMADVYRNVETHLKVCDKIAKDVFGEDVIPEAAVTIHNVIMDFFGLTKRVSQILNFRRRLMDQKSDEELVSLKQRVLYLELRVRELEEKLQNSFTQYPIKFSGPITYYPQNTPYATDEAPQFLTGMSNGEITYYN
jgi:hypothetical protein